MRPGIIIAIVAAVAVVIGGVVWYNSHSEQVRLDQQRTDQAAQVARDEEAARDEEIAREEEAAATDQSAREAEEAEALPAQDSAVEQDEAAARDEDAIVVGDEITEDTIVVQSATDEAVVLDPDETTTTAAIVDDAPTADAAAPSETQPETQAADVTQEGVDDAAETDATAGSAATATTTTEPDELLTPANFERDEVLALIDESEQLSDDERSTLRAVVEGASANPAMVEAAIESIRAALDLPALN